MLYTNLNKDTAMLDNVYDPAIKNKGNLISKNVNNKPEIIESTKTAGMICRHDAKPFLFCITRIL